MNTPRLTPLLLLLILLVAPLSACSDDTETDPGDTVNNGLLDADFPDEDSELPDAEEPDTDLADADEPQPDVETPDADIEEEEPVVLPPECDRDGDGVANLVCGGTDCDDTERLKAPGIPERCDELDNNCDGRINEGIPCTFYAHTGEGLYAIDPFTKTQERIADVPNLFDIDTHPDGTLYGITATSLHRFDEGSRRWLLVGDFPEIEDGTGLAIDSFGDAWVTAADNVYTVDLTTARATRVGSLGGDFYSSGDCLVNKQDSLYMTSKAFDQPDTLVIIDRNTGRATAIGSVGFTNVFGLTAGWGSIFGLNSRGEMIRIDPTTGAGELVHTFEGLRWFGAASHPAR